MQKKLPYLYLTLSTLALTACGGSSSSDDDAGVVTPPPPTASLSANNDTAVTLNGMPITIDVAENDSYSGDGSLSVNILEFDEAYGELDVSGVEVTFTPAESFWGEMSFVYEITDGDLTDEASVEVTSAQSLVVAGQVTDAPIADAYVTIHYLEQEFTAQADEYGHYEIVIEFADDASNEVVRISAQGHADNDQAYVTLSSILGGFEQLKAQADETYKVGREQSNQVQVTQISTAIDVLTRANVDGEVTSDNFEAAETALNADLVLEMAGVIKLLVDNPSYELPEGFDTIEAFLSDPEAYNVVVETASESGDLDDAIAQTVADSNVMPTLDEAQLVGDYFTNIAGSNVLGYAAGTSWRFYENGRLEMGSKGLGSTNWTVTQANWALDEQQLTISNSEPVGGYMWGFPAHWQDAFEAAGYEHIDELAAYLGERQLSLPYTYVMRYEDVSIVSQTSNSTILKVTEEQWLSTFEFEYEGQSYQTPEVKLSEFSGQRTLTRVASVIQHKGTFELDNETPWVLPVVSVSKLHPSSLASADFIHFDGDEAGAFYGQFSEVQGQWALSNGGSTLTLQYPFGSQDVTTTLDVANFEGLQTSAVVEHAITGDGEVDFESLIYLRRVAPYTPIDNEVLSHDDDEFIARFLSQPAHVWTGNLPPKSILNSTWYFQSDGTTRGVTRYCDGEWTNWGHCEDDATHFELGSTAGSFMWRLSGSDALELYRGDFIQAVYSAIDYDDETQAMNIVEYWPDGAVDAPLSLSPRIKPWVRISHIDFLTGNDDQSDAVNYRIMRSTPNETMSFGGIEAL